MKYIVIDYKKLTDLLKNVMSRFLNKVHHKEFIYVKPEEFAKYKEIALSKGFKYVESGPLVRSSYHAEKHLF